MRCSFVDKGVRRKSSMEKALSDTRLWGTGGLRKNDRVDGRYAHRVSLTGKVLFLLEGKVALSTAVEKRSG